MGRKIGTVLSFLLVATESFTAIFFTPLLIRTLGQAEYGVYTLVLSITSYLFLLDLGVGNSVVKYMSKYKANEQIEEQRSFLGITTIYYFLLACIILIMGLILQEMFPNVFSKGLSISEIDLAKELFLITIINAAITIGTSGFFYTIISYEKFFISKGFVILSTIFRVVISYVALLLGMKSIEIVTITMIMTLLTRGSMVCYVLFRLKLLPSIKGAKLKQIKEIISYSIFVFLQMVATQINSMADQVLIGIMTTSAASILAIYGVGAQLNQYFQSFGSSINSILMPGVVRMIEGKAPTSDIQNEMVKIGRLNFMFIGFVWCVFLVFGQQFVNLWAGEKNAESYWIALVLMFPHVIIITQAIGSQILWAKNKHKIQAIIKFIVVIINIIFSVFLIQWNPLWGATLSTFGSIVFGDIILIQLIFKKDIGIDLRFYYRGILKGIFLSLVIAVIFGFVFKSINLLGWGGFIVNSISISIVYFVCLLLFGFDSKEKSVFLKILKKVF